MAKTKRTYTKRAKRAVKSKAVKAVSSGKRGRPRSLPAVAQKEAFIQAVERVKATRDVRQGMLNTVFFSVGSTLGEISSCFVGRKKA